MVRTPCGTPLKRSSPLCLMGEVLPCMRRSALTTLPPKWCPIDWWPRQTPNNGTLPPKASIISRLTPASLGEQGPGDMRTLSGLKASASSTVI